MDVHPKVSLIHRPTPLHRLERASADLGLDLWIKRDDLTGFALGGNKGRKLEFLMADVLKAQAQVVVTCGSVQSNFVRQLGAACAVLGIKCAVAVMDTPYEYELPAQQGLTKEGGNKALGDWLGIEFHTFPDGTWNQLFNHAAELVSQFKDQGKVVYEIPVGGSSPLGAFAFYEAGRELQAQITAPFDTIIFASSSGSTQVGLSYAFRNMPTRVVGVACDPEPDLAKDFAELGAGLAEILGQSALLASELHLDFGYVGPGYGIPSERGNEAIRYLARTEGIFLDPVYSGKAFSGLLAMAARKEFTGPVCFWHTGGIPALFAM